MHLATGVGVVIGENGWISMVADANEADPSVHLYFDHLYSPTRCL